MKIRFLVCSVTVLSAITALNAMDAPAHLLTADELTGFASHGKQVALEVLNRAKAEIRKEPSTLAASDKMLLSLEEILDMTAPDTELHAKALAEYKAYGQAIYEGLSATNLEQVLNPDAVSDKQLVGAFKEHLKSVAESIARQRLEPKTWADIKQGLKFAALDGWHELGKRTFSEIIEYLKTVVLSKWTSVENATLRLTDMQTEPARFLEGILSGGSSIDTELYRKAFTEFKAYWFALYECQMQDNLDEILRTENDEPQIREQVKQLLRDNAKRIKLLYLNPKSFREVEIRRKMSNSWMYEWFGRKVAFAILDCFEACFLEGTITKEEAERYTQIALTLPLLLNTDALNEFSAESNLHKNAFGEFIMFLQTIYTTFMQEKFTASPDKSRIAELMAFVRAKAEVLKNIVDAQTWPKAKLKYQELIGASEITEHDLQKYSELTKKARSVTHHRDRALIRKPDGIDIRLYTDDFVTTDYNPVPFKQRSSMNMEGLKADRRLNDAEKTKMAQNEDYKKGFAEGLHQVRKFKVYSQGLVPNEPNSRALNEFDNNISYAESHADDNGAFLKVRMFANGVRTALEQSDLKQINENELVRKYYANYLKQMQIFSYAFSIKDALKMKVELLLYA